MNSKNVLSLRNLAAIQYQQSWAYAHNVNLVAANANWQAVNTTGSGIYAGRLGAQKVFFSEIPTSKVLVARLPINLPSEDETPYIKPDEEIKEYPKYVQRLTQDDNFKPVFYKNVRQDNMDLAKVRFLDFIASTNFSGTVCMGDFCCSYNIEISKNNGPNVDNGVSFHFFPCYFATNSKKKKFNNNNLYFSHHIRMGLHCSMIFINLVNRNSCARNKSFVASLRAPNGTISIHVANDSQGK